MDHACQVTTSASDGSHGTGVLRPRSLVAGRYRIDRLVGRGGMGCVYKAYDLLLREPVALKIIEISTAFEWDALAEAIAEVRVARRVSHPHVCRVHDIGCHESTTSSGVKLWFFSMQFVRGSSLRAWLEDHPPTVVQVKRWARHILRGLGAVHEAGVVHGDVKAENILIRGRDGEAAILADFGCASLRRSATRWSGRTAPLRGSLLYMAPEQLDGATVTAATDIYAFGVMLHEMLTGEPFCADLSLRATTARLDAREDAAIRDFEALPSELRDFVARCLRTSRSERFHDAPSALKAFDASVWSLRQ